MSAIIVSLLDPFVDALKDALIDAVSSQAKSKIRDTLTFDNKNPTILHDNNEIDTKKETCITRTKRINFKIKVLQ